jgi:hypothetical protein
MTTRIEICNRALTRIGDQPLQSESAPRADVVLQVYADAIAVLNALTPWSFSRRVIQLAREAAVAPAPRAYQYKLPADRSGPPRAVYNSLDALKADRPYLDYELSKDLLLTDAEEIFLRYQAIPAIDVWSPLFEMCVITLTAADCAMALHDDEDRRTKLRNEVLGDPRVPGALGLVARAIQADAQGQPSQTLLRSGGPFIDVRRS